MIRLQTLGTADLTDVAGRPLRAVLAQPKRFALLAYLAIAQPTGHQRRDTLRWLFWPELDEERARASLSQALYYLRRSLGEGVLTSRGKEEVALDRTSIWCDAVSVREALADGRAETLTTAMELYRGELLPGFHVPGAAEFEHWLDEERRRLARAVADGAWQAARRAAVDDLPSDALWWTRRALSVAGWEEAPLRDIFDRLAASGHAPEALLVYEEAADRLRRDLELEPPADLRRGAEALRASSPRRSDLGEPAEAGPQLPDTQYLRSGTGSPSAPAPTRNGLRHPGWLTAVLAAAAIIVMTIFAHLRGGPEVDRSRVAVLPIRYIGPNADNAWLADGLTAELIARMATLRDLRVIPFSTIMRFRGPEPDLDRIERELNAGTLVEGSVRSLGDTLRIAVVLVDARSRQPIWSGSYDARMDQLLTVQRHIAEDAARALKVDLRPDAVRRQAERWPGSEAYTEYLRGRALLGAVDVSALRQALGHFHRARSHDSTFALALSGLSAAYVQLIMNFAVPYDSAPRVREFAEQALAIDPDLPEAHASLALVLSKYYWDSDAAERHFKRAITLDPSSADAYRGYATHLRDQAEFDRAYEQIQMAADLDRSPASTLEKAVILYLWGRYDAAIATARPLLHSARDAPRAWLTIALAHTAAGNYEAALATLDHADPERVRPTMVTNRAYLYAKVGRTREARQLLERGVSGSPPLMLFQQAVVHTALGERDRALALLEQEADRRGWLIRLAKVEPSLDPLRDDPQFERLLARIGFASPTRAMVTPPK